MLFESASVALPSSRTGLPAWLQAASGRPGPSSGTCSSGAIVGLGCILPSDRTPAPLGLIFCAGLIPCGFFGWWSQSYTLILILFCSVSKMASFDGCTNQVCYSNTHTPLSYASYNPNSGPSCTSSPGSDAASFSSTAPTRRTLARGPSGRR